MTMFDAPPPISHPARFSDPILLVIARALRRHGAHGEFRPAHGEFGPARILDPFAGTGKGVEFLRALGYDAVGTELEPEWIASPHVRAADFFAVAEPAASYDAVVTSPAYGNRMADHHEARDESRRNTYRHRLGRALSPNSGAGLQWGDEYREFHERAWREVARYLRPGGLFVLNVKAHIRKGQIVDVPEWHRRTCEAMPFVLLDTTDVPCPGNRQGENGDARVETEQVFVFTKEGIT